jgi:signal transduction histidine kinase
VTTAAETLPAARTGARPARRRTANQWFVLTVGALVALSALSVVASIVSLQRLGDARTLLVDRLDPSVLDAERLSTALVDQETGVRGFALTGEERFLEPYRRGRRDAARSLFNLQDRSRQEGVAQLRDDLGEVQRLAGDWQRTFAGPIIAGRRRGDDPELGRQAAGAGKASFDRLRASLTRMQRNLVSASADARRRLHANGRNVFALAVGSGLLLLVTVLASGLVLRHVVVAPLQQLAGRVRRVARGDFRQEVRGTGAREVVDLGEDVEAMRNRILAEVEALRAAQSDLERSNAELEQFAYVASHDLQEPLRKVASFCQLLQRRYGGQLDERADQYIGFAVDGAKRMQDLINDLLAFSRVGRSTQAMTSVDCAALVARAESNLATVIEESGAQIRTGLLPRVHGDPALLGQVFQNLIGNALKYRGEAAPVVELDARRDGPMWELRCSDNGIGIDPEYAERIFVLFQRLHGRGEYEGTGIGLAMCRKIVEHHGGRIWLDPIPGPGSTFRFTLPAEQPADQPPDQPVDTEGSNS